MGKGKSAQRRWRGAGRTRRGQYLGSQVTFGGSISPLLLYAMSGPGGEHNRPSDCWIVVDRKVYDVTQWAKSHPGGEDNILQLAGQDRCAG